MAIKIGKRTIGLENRPSILSYGSIVGKKEHEGPKGYEFDAYDNDCRFGEDSFEKAESRLQKIKLDAKTKSSTITLSNSPGILILISSRGVSSVSQPNCARNFRASSADFTLS